MEYDITVINRRVTTTPREYVLECEEYFNSRVRKAAADIVGHLDQSPIVLLSGPSGSGKTTVTNLIARLYDPDSGSVEVGGIDVRKLKLDSLYDTVGYVTQEPSVYGDMSVRENLRYFARILGAPPSRISEAIDEVDLRAQADQLTRTLSGGERSRVSLATALLGRPELLLLDEPRSASIRCSGATSGRCSTSSPRPGERCSSPAT